MSGRQRYRGDWPGMPDRTHRQLEKLRNLHVAIELRDNLGDSSPASQAARLEAIRRIDPAGCRRGLRIEVPARRGTAGCVVHVSLPDEDDGEQDE
jgi:hypothetical protein